MATGRLAASSIIRSKASQPHFLDRWFCVPSRALPSLSFVIVGGAGGGYSHSSALGAHYGHGPGPRAPANRYTAYCIMNSFTPIAFHSSHFIKCCDFYLFCLRLKTFTYIIPTALYHCNATNWPIFITQEFSKLPLKCAPYLRTKKYIHSFENIFSLLLHAYFP